MPETGQHSPGTNISAHRTAHYQVTQASFLYTALRQKSDCSMQFDSPNEMRSIPFWRPYSCLPSRFAVPDTAPLPSAPPPPGSDAAFASPPALAEHSPS
eukprot:1512749-Rhodomonas_salina.3